MSGSDVSGMAVCGSTSGFDWSVPTLKGESSACVPFFLFSQSSTTGCRRDDDVGFPFCMGDGQHQSCLRNGFLVVFDVSLIISYADVS
jgi:hypothetical protein